MRIYLLLIKQTSRNWLILRGASMVRRKSGSWQMPTEEKTRGFVLQETGQSESLNWRKRGSSWWVDWRSAQNYHHRRIIQAQKKGGTVTTEHEEKHVNFHIKAFFLCEWSGLPKVLLRTPPNHHHHLRHTRWIDHPLRNRRVSSPVNSANEVL